MDWQTAINLGGGALLVAVGWWCRTIWESLAQLRADLHALEVALPRDYVPKVDIERIEERIMDRFDRLETKIDEKADK